MPTTHGSAILKMSASSVSFEFLRIVSEVEIHVTTFGDFHVSIKKLGTGQYEQKKCWEDEKRKY